jgi:hypothetical protein
VKKPADRRRISGPGQSPTSDNLVDVTPLSRPSNPFRFGAAVMARYRKAAGPGRKVLDERITWLLHLGNRIQTEHTMPVLMMALTACATDGDTRIWFRECLDAIDDEIAASTGSKRRRRAEEPEHDEAEQEDELDELDDLEEALGLQANGLPPEGV